MAKSLKLPPLNEQTKILSFDIESNGLHGEAFAVGAVVMDARGSILDQFSGRTAIHGPVDPWVKQHVLPAVEGMPVDYKNSKDLREGFWDWYLVNEPKSDYVLVNNGYPVEYRFLLQCQEDDLKGRYWLHPFPILDLTSLLLHAGQKTQIKNNQRRPHHPVDDAITAAIAAFNSFL